MAETYVNGTNGSSAIMEDADMKEELAVETSIDESHLRVDPTDPQPPPQPPAPAMHPEHLSTIQPVAPPAAATPPPVAPSSVARPGSMPPQPSAKPDKPVAHGGPTRQYLNQNVTPHLLEAMKYLAMYEPEKPLMWLSDFLRDRSREVEG